MPSVEYTLTALNNFHCRVLTIKAQDISIIIPVKNNQTGIDGLLSQFFATHEPEYFPAEIIIVDNNSSIPITLQTHFDQYGVSIQCITCLKPGPAAARNQGAVHAKGAWLLFVDSDCIPTNTLIPGYLSANEGAIGYQGTVAAFDNDVISNYYVSQHIHRPPAVLGAEEGAIPQPQCLVSANILILTRSFEQVKGFNETFLVGGEDTDLGLRLAQLGPLKYAHNAVVLHCYDDGLTGFIRRFFAYGKGNRLLRHYHKIPLLPLPFTAKNKTVIANHFLAVLQWGSLLAGYAAKDVNLKLTRLRTGLRK